MSIILPLDVSKLGDCTEAVWAADIIEVSSEAPFNWYFCLDSIADFFFLWPNAVVKASIYIPLEKVHLIHTRKAVSLHF